MLLFFCIVIVMTHSKRKHQSEVIFGIAPKKYLAFSIFHTFMIISSLFRFATSFLVIPCSTNSFILFSSSSVRTHCFGLVWLLNVVSLHYVLLETAISVWQFLITCMRPRFSFSIVLVTCLYECVYIILTFFLSLFIYLFFLIFYPIWYRYVRWNFIFCNALAHTKPFTWSYCWD